MHRAQRLINHVALVLDASVSMSTHKSELIRVADEQIRYLALRSEELEQETRVSVYTFSDDVKCLIFDMDVMRLPSIADLYRIEGMTALVDAVVKSQEDLSTTSRIYGDHAFLSFFLTDGMENASRNSWRVLPRYFNKSGWSLGFLIPKSSNRIYFDRMGIDSGNVATWDTESVQGIADSFGSIREATDTFMNNRASGIQASTVFSTGTDTVNKETVKNLKPVKVSKTYYVTDDSRIDEFYNVMYGTYPFGHAYYQLTKRETIQPTKGILVLDKRTQKVYGGPDARKLIGLPDETIKVSPNHNPDYEIFVQSTSYNRKLKAGTKTLMV